MTESAAVRALLLELLREHVKLAIVARSVEAEWHSYQRNRRPVILAGIAARRLSDVSEPELVELVRGYQLGDETQTLIARIAALAERAGAALDTVEAAA